MLYICLHFTYMCNLKFFHRGQDLDIILIRVFSNYADIQHALYANCAYVMCNDLWCFLFSFSSKTIMTQFTKIQDTKAINTWEKPQREMKKVWPICQIYSQGSKDATVTRQ